MKAFLSIFWVFIGFTFVAATPSSKQISVENSLKELNSDTKINILERMKFYNVENVSIAVINDNRIEWAKAYGNNPSINEHTLFQAGSVSKPLTAFGVLLLVQQGKIALDEDVNVYLKRWKIPENIYIETKKVTLRQLLSHTAGTSIDGFPGYSVKGPIPDIVEILQGNKSTVNTKPILMVAEPATGMKYSGGGTLIVQLLIEDITNQPFAIWMQNNVLIPLGMCESSFEQPLSTYKALHAAPGYHNGVLMEGKWNVYPELSAAGLWSTPRDLAKLIIYIQCALKNEATNILNPEFVKQMITRQKIGGKEIESGLGLFLENSDQNLIFEHDGQNFGFITRFLGYAYHGKGVVIMMNNDTAWPLMKEITFSVAKSYNWPIK